MKPLVAAVALLVALAVGAQATARRRVGDPVQDGPVL